MLAHMNTHSQSQQLFTAVAAVQTARPARYGKQLMQHMSHKVQAAWDEQSGTGAVVFNDQVRAQLTAADTVLEMRLAATDAQLLERYEWVLGNHLVRFARKDNLEVLWQRSYPDGQPVTGSVQNFEIVERVLRERKAEAQS